MVHFTSTVTHPDRINIGRGVCTYFASSAGCYFSGINGIDIGDDTMFAPGVKVISANHTLGNLGEHDADPPIRIGRRCWLGANCVILPGVVLGDQTVVAAGAVVTKSYPSGGVVLAGVPARPIKDAHAAK